MSLLLDNEIDNDIEYSVINVSYNNMNIVFYYDRQQTKNLPETISTPKISRSLTPMKRLSPFRASPLKKGILSPKSVDPQITELKERLRKVKLAMAYEDELCSKQLINSIEKWKKVAQIAFERLFVLAKNAYPETKERDILKSMGISPMLVDISDEE